MRRAQIARKIETSLTKALLLAQQHQLGDIAYLIQMSLTATGREIRSDRGSSLPASRTTPLKGAMILAAGSLPRLLKRHPKQRCQHGQICTISPCCHALQMVDDLGEVLSHCGMYAKAHGN